MADLYRSDMRDIDLNKPLLRTNVGVLLATGDKGANRFGANLYRDGEAVSVTGAAVTGYMMRPGMDTLVCEGVVSDNTVYVDLPAACYTQEGAFSLALKVSSTEITQTVRVIDGHIRLTQTDTLIDPGDVVPSLDDLLAHIAAMEAATAEANTAAAAANEARENIQGDLDALSEDIGGIKEFVGSPVEQPIELNYFDSTNLETELNNAARGRTSIFKIPKLSTFAISDTTYQYHLMKQTYTDGVQTTETITSSWTSGSLLIAGSNDTYYRAMLRRADKASMANDDLSGVYFTVTPVEKEYEFYSAEKNELVCRVLDDIDSKTFVFLWSSDNHYNETVRSGVCQVQYAEEMAELARDIGADCIVNTGDICASDHDDTGETPDLNVNRSRMKDIVGGFIKYRQPFLYAFGHHEVYPFVEMENGESKYAIDKSIICNIGHQVMNYRPYTVYQDDDRSKPNFYTDVTDKAHGRYIRMIFLDGTSVLAVGYSYNTIKFLESALESVPDGYSVMCFSHTPTRESAVGRVVHGGNIALAGDYLPADVEYNNETIESVIEAFIEGGGNFIGFFHGHTHCDNVVKDADMGFNLISIACQMVGTADGAGITSNANLACYSGRNEYYQTAYCFDIACVHPDKRTIKLFRFGVGDDRTITY